MLSGFVNYKLPNKSPLVNPWSTQKDSLEIIDISSKGSLGKIEDFLPQKDKDKVLLDS